MDPLLLLHLSDLHIGPKSRFPAQDLEAVAQRIDQAIGEACQRLGWQERVGLCVVTGDIAEAARPPEYRDAVRFFLALTGHMGLARDRFVFVPGNHDVSWRLTREVEGAFKDGEFDRNELEQRIAARKFEHFSKFLRDFHGKDSGELEGITRLGHGVHVHRLESERISVALLDSCEQESHVKQGGFLGKEQSQALMDHWQSPDSHGWLKIVAVHHNPIAAVDAGTPEWRQRLEKALPDDDSLGHFVADAIGFEGKEYLRRIVQDCQVSLVLHGHQHASDRTAWPWAGSRKGQAQVLSAGSLAADPKGLPEDQPNMLHLVRLDPDRQEARSLFLMYSRRARAPGSVEPGQFVIDPATPDAATLDLSQPDGFTRRATIPAPADETALGRRTREFIREYRDRLKRRFIGLDLSGVGAVQKGGAGRPIEARLDDMYHPLRLYKDHDPDKLEQGTVLKPTQLLARTDPLAVIGVAGSGKTTWLRWTFRRLVETDEALPFMIELRALAKIWTEQQTRGEARSLDRYLSDWVAQSGVSGWKEALPEAMKATVGPRPVLLVDGWDELGPLGEELRAGLLALLDAYPRVLAIVTSRPYGEGRPSHSEKFETRYIGRRWRRVAGGSWVGGGRREVVGGWEECEQGGGGGGGSGTTRGRSLALGASTPWKRVRLARGGGTRAARRRSNSRAVTTRWVEPSGAGRLSL